MVIYINFQRKIIKKMDVNISYKILHFIESSIVDSPLYTSH